MTGDAGSRAADAKKICVVTIHGIGFQEPPRDGVPGYADGLHEDLARALDGKLGGDPLARPKPGGPVYVTSAKPGTRDREWGLARLGTWRGNSGAGAPANPGGPATGITAPPLTDGDQPVAHVALVYTPFEETGPGLGASAGVIAEAGMHFGRYSPVPHALATVIGDVWAGLRGPHSSEPPGSQLRPRHHDAGTMGVVATLEDDLVAYISRNDLREEIREFVAEALRRIVARPDVAGVVINAHSQGTVVAFDVLRRDGPGSCVRALVTAGSPLRKYADLFSWGNDADGIKHMKWANFWDDKDPVADPLDPPASWRPGDPPSRAAGELGLFWATNDDATQVPVPIEDKQVSNVRHSSPAGLRAHNYWGNAVEFVPALARLLEAELGSPTAVGAPVRAGT